MYDTTSLITTILKNASILLSLEGAARDYYALSLLYKLGGRATPARIKHELNKHKLMSYRTFLKAINDLQAHGIVKKEWGEYVIVEKYMPSLKLLLEETPSRVHEVLDKFLKEKISADNAHNELYLVFKDMNTIFPHKDNPIIELVYLIDLYLVGTVYRLISRIDVIEDLKEKIRYMEIYVQKPLKIMSASTSKDSLSPESKEGG